jgi:hypothetical protein
MSVKKTASILVKGCLLLTFVALGLSAVEPSPPIPVKKMAANNAGAAAPKAAVDMPATKVVAPPEQQAVIKAPATSKVIINNEFSVTYNSVSGDGKANSSLSDGMHMLDVFTINSYGTLSNGYRFNYNVGLKATDDKRNDIKNLSLTNLNYMMTNDINTWNFGDIFESYSQYSLNTALKGASWRHMLSSQDEELSRSLGLVAGLAYPRWDCFYGGMETKMVPRNVIGANYRQMYLPNFAMGYTGVYVNDMERVNPTDTLLTNTVFAADAQYQPFSGLILTANWLFQLSAAMSLRTTALPCGFRG